MKKGQKSLLAPTRAIVFAAIWLFLPGLVFAGELDPPAGPDHPDSAMYTLEDIYIYLETGVAGIKRTGGFVEPASPPESTGHTLDEVHKKVGDKCITCEGALSTGGRWCDNGDGTVKDMSTGLLWLKNADCMVRMIWVDAIKAPIVDLRDGYSSCDLTDGSVWGDWRLPTIDELQGITQGTEYVRSGNMHFFTNVQSGRYWSSTTLEQYSESAWYMVMTDGQKGLDFKDDFYLYYHYVWPVRADY